MVVSPCTTFTLPANVASFFLSRISSEAASIWIGWSRFCEKPCIALGTPCIVLCAAALPPIIASARAAAQAQETIRRIRMLGGENIILKIILSWLTCPRLTRLVATGGLQKDILAQVQQLLLGIEQPVARVQRHGRPIFHQELCP